jgi:hypothetical protein
MSDGKNKPRLVLRVLVALLFISFVGKLASITIEGRTSNKKSGIESELRGACRLVIEYKAINGEYPKRFEDLMLFLDNHDEAQRPMFSEFSKRPTAAIVEAYIFHGADKPILISRESESGRASLQVPSFTITWHDEVSFRQLMESIKDDSPAL